MESPAASESEHAPAHWRRAWLLLAAAILFAGAVRARLLDLPLERDEGEYAYAGQLLLQGHPPYELAYNMKLPGTYAAYAAGMALFGQTPAGIHLLLLVAGSLNILFVFLLARHLGGDLAGGVAAISYAVMSISPSVVGLAAHATHFVVLFAVPATWLLLTAKTEGKGKRIFFSGLLFGLAFLMKQQGLCFGLFGFACLGWRAARAGAVFSGSFAKQMLVFGAGMALPYLGTSAILGCMGVFDRFWFWTVAYARYYETTLPLRAGIDEYLGQHLRDTRDLSMGLWALVALGLASGMLSRRWRAPMLWTGVFWLFSFLGTAAGLYFRGHYFIMVLPAFAILAGLSVAALRNLAPTRVLPEVFRSLPVIAFGLILSWMIFYQARVFFEWPVAQVTRTIYSGNPCAEAIAAADEIREHSNAKARVAVIGSEPEIYFYAQRHSATGYIYTYALMEPQPYAGDMQREMAREVETNSPEFLVNVPYRSSWMTRRDSSRYLATWFEAYRARYYREVGAVGYENAPGGRLICLWGSELKDLSRLSTERLEIYERADWGP